MVKKILVGNVKRSAQAEAHTRAGRLEKKAQLHLSPPLAG